METNEVRLKMLRAIGRAGLKPAPTIRGYFFGSKVVAETIAKNERFANGEAAKPRLLGIFLDSAPYCNLKCPICYSSSKWTAGKVPFNERKLEIWKRTARIGREFGVKSIVFAGQGEPLLDPAVPEMLKFATDQGLWSVLFTNNTLIDAKMAEFLYRLNVSVIAKCGSDDPQKQDALVGVRDAHRAIYRGLAHLLVAGFAKEGRLGIDATIMRSSLKDLAGLFVFCRLNGIVPYFEFPVEEGRAATWRRMTGERLANDEMLAFFERLRVIDEKMFGYTWAIVPGIHTLAHERCSKGKVMLTVRDDLKVDACVNLFQGGPLGDLNESDLDGILTRRNIRKLSALPCCSKCGVIRQVSP